MASLGNFTQTQTPYRDRDRDQILSVTEGYGEEAFVVIRTCKPDMAASDPA